MTVLRLALVALLVAPPLAAQGTQAPREGALIRWTESGRRVEGYLLVDADPGQPLRVWNKLASRPQELGWDTPGLAERVKPGRRKNGTLMGFGIGAMIGAGVGLMSGDDECSGDYFCVVQLSAGQKAAGLGAMLGVVGAVVGVAASPGAVWAPLGTGGDGVRLSALLAPGRVGMRLEF